MWRGGKEKHERQKIGYCSIEAGTIAQHSMWRGGKEKHERQKIGYCSIEAGTIAQHSMWRGGKEKHERQKQPCGSECHKTSATAETVGQMTRLEADHEWL
eukprot:jgi/Antlo1/2556/1192